MPPRFARRSTQFGPRGRSPIERQKDVGGDEYLRFLASGALCCSAAHLLLTPIDVVKTKLQTSPKVYTNPLQAFKKVVEEDGIPGFFQGWIPTFGGYLCWGGISYSLTEFTRRVVVNNVVGPLNAPDYEIPIILFAAATGGEPHCTYVFSSHVISCANKINLSNIISSIRGLVRAFFL